MSAFAAIENRTYVSNTSTATTNSQTLVRVYLVNGESRCLRLDDRTEVTVSVAAERVGGIYSHFDLQYKRAVLMRGLGLGHSSYLQAIVPP